MRQRISFPQRWTMPFFTLKTWGWRKSLRPHQSFPFGAPVCWQYTLRVEAATATQTVTATGLRLKHPAAVRLMLSDDGVVV